MELQRYLCRQQGGRSVRERVLSSLFFIQRGTPAHALMAIQCVSSTSAKPLPAPARNFLVNTPRGSFPWCLTILTNHSESWGSGAWLTCLACSGPQVYHISETRGLLKTINSVLQKITDPIQPKVAEHRPQTTKRLSYPFSREKQHL